MDSDLPQGSQDETKPDGPGDDEKFLSACRVMRQGIELMTKGLNLGEEAHAEMVRGVITAWLQVRQEGRPRVDGPGGFIAHLLQSRGAEFDVVSEDAGGRPPRGPGQFRKPGKA
jgi:hypothetical protein